MILSPYNAPTRVLDARVVCDPPRKKVVIIGFSDTAMAVKAFQRDPTWEIWGLNHGYALSLFWDEWHRFRADRWFEMHPIRVQPVNDLSWMHTCPIPIYVLDQRDPHPEGYSPNTVTYPREACEHVLPVPFANPGYWACTFAYQIALAIVEGFEEIALVGLDFASPREWLFERSNTLFWAGVAAGRGIKLSWPRHSTIFEHPYAYGYDYEGEIQWCQRGVDRWTNAWGYELRPDAAEMYRERERQIQEAIAR